MQNLEKHFEKFRKNTIGNEQYFETPYGRKKMIYADWIASGRLYAPIEERITKVIGPFVGNTHTETSETGTLMTKAYHYAHRKIKDHVHAGPDDVIITAGFGMTEVINKLQRILGFKNCATYEDGKCIPKREKPVVFITHMEHHSNQTSWLETIADCEIIHPTEKGLVDYDYFSELLEKYKNRELKIGSFTAASNVTGVQTDYHRLAKMMHKYGGLCFVDFAMAAPYTDINMHPIDKEERLDAIFFSPHKFLGGPGSSGVLIFDSKLYHRSIPDNPGGGTVEWTNPWGGHRYFDDIELREDGGTPGFLQAIRAALAIRLKEDIGVSNIQMQEEALLSVAFLRMKKMKNLHLLANNLEHRLGVLSFFVEDIHYNLIVKLLNDVYGVQVRGGCSCAGTYGHFLLHVDPSRSQRITDKINNGDWSEKPGWVRLSLHPTMTIDELKYILDAIEDIILNIDNYSKNYSYSAHTNEFSFNGKNYLIDVNNWFLFD